MDDDSPIKKQSKLRRAQTTLSDSFRMATSVLQQGGSGPSKKALNLVIPSIIKIIKIFVYIKKMIIKNSLNVKFVLCNSGVLVNIIVEFVQMLYVHHALIAL